MIRRPPRSTRTDTLFPTRRSSDLAPRGEAPGRGRRHRAGRERRMTDGDLLKLKAVDAEDLAVVAGALQDAIVPVGDMAWLDEDGRLVFVATRFRSEAGASGPRRARVHAGARGRRSEFTVESGVSQFDKQ